MEGEETAMAEKERVETRMDRRDSESYRREARAGLKGGWLKAVVAGLVLILLGGVLLPADIQEPEGEAYFLETRMVASIGPLREEIEIGSFLGRMEFKEILDKAEPGALIFFAAAYLLLIVYLALTPVAERGWTRLGVRAVRGEKPGMGVLRHVSYWKTVRVMLLQKICAYWPMIPVMIGSSVLNLWAGKQSMDMVERMLILSNVTMLITSALLGFNALRFEPALWLMEMRPRKNARQLIKMSRKLMKRQVFRLFCLNFSFIGWQFLSVLPVIIGAAVVTGAEVRGAVENIGLSAADPVMLICQALSLAILIPVTVYQYTAKAAFVRELAGESDWEDPAEEEEEPAQAEEQMQEKGENQNAE